MIKRYGQFVNGKVNEEFVMTEPNLNITPMSTPMIPDNIQMRTGVQNLVEPMTQNKSMSQFDGEEEEVGVDKYTDALKKLSDASKEDFSKVYNKVEKSVTVKGKKVSFPAETEKYHVEGVKKPFETLQEVLDFFERGISPQARQEVRGEMSSIKDEGVLDRVEQFESKSYKSKRIMKK